eukprot:4826432-Pleurochrysis_carterae.AAC.1
MNAAYLHDYRNVVGLSGGYIHIAHNVPVLPSGTPASTWTSYLTLEGAEVVFARNVGANMLTQHLTVL